MSVHLLFERPLVVVLNVVICSASPHQDDSGVWSSHVNLISPIKRYEHGLVAAAWFTLHALYGSPRLRLDLPQTSSISIFFFPNRVVSELVDQPPCATCRALENTLLRWLSSFKW